MSILNVQNLTKRYRSKTALSELNLDVKPGEYIGLIGPNGAGKSTFFNSVMSRLVWDSGTISVNGISVGSKPIDARKSIGFVPQDLVLFDYLTGEEYLRFVGELRGLKKADLDIEVPDAVVRCVGIKVVPIADLFQLLA